METRELLLREGTLCAPTVGVWRSTVRGGDALPAGRVVGTLEVLGRRLALIVPAGVRGVALPVRAGPSPVEYGEVLIEVGAGGAVEHVEEVIGPAEVPGGLAVTAPIDGIFYRRPAPDQPNFVEVGAVVTQGVTVGLMEVMKTFHPVTYGGPGLPDPARVVAIPPRDQQEMAAGDVLLVVESV
jgi:acetyl-CoA carboxylase biotin carboxyl carrier protein